METKTTLTKTEMAALAAYELELRSALADYLRSAGRVGLELMRSIWKRVTGDEFNETDACGHCQLRLQKAVAEWWQNTLDAEAEKAKKAEAKANKKK